MSIRCWFTGHRYTNTTGLFSKTLCCLKCGRLIGNVTQDALDKHEEAICTFITGDNRITRKTTVKVMFDAMREQLGHGR